MAISQHFCSGAVVSESKILTAKHCVEWIFTQNEDNKDFDLESDFFVVSSNRLKEPKRLKIQSIHLSPPTTYFNFDLAIIEVNANLELPQYEILGALNLQKVENISVITTGYGCDLVADPTYSNNRGSQTVKTGVRKVLNFSSIFLMLEKQSGVNATSLCPGDSGSPAFIEVDGKLAILGVNQSLRLENIAASDIDSNKRLNRSAFINSKFNRDIITRIDRVADENNNFWLRSILKP